MVGESLWLSPYTTSLEGIYLSRLCFPIPLSSQHYDTWQTRSNLTFQCAQINRTVNIPLQRKPQISDNIWCIKSLTCCPSLAGGTPYILAMLILYLRHYLLIPVIHDISVLTSFLGRVVELC